MTTAAPEEILSAYPLSFLEVHGSRRTVDEKGDEIVLPRSVWEAWADLYPAGSPMLVELIHPDTGHRRVVCAAGQFHVETNNHLYVPNWILQPMKMGIADEYEEGVLLFARPVLETPPRATLIVLKPLDNALYDTDMRALFEERLYTFHSLQTGTTLSVHLQDLGGLEAYARVERLEPTDLVVLGSEVNVEFVEPELAALAAETTDPAVLLPSAEETETAEERMARIRASWIQKMRGAGAGAQNT